MGMDSFFPFALTARWLAYASLPRALLWAVFLLGLRPVLAQMYPPKLFAGLPRLARNICYTISLVVFLFGLRSAILRKPNCYTIF